MPLNAGIPPGAVPDHTLLRSIARGSYGEVWLARSTLGAFRAIKFIHRSRFERPEPFLRELAGITKFEPVSRGHDGLTDILHVGHNDLDGYFYYVMELADDQVRTRDIEADTYVARTLASELQQRQVLPLEECIHIAVAMTKAMQYLHEHGLVHRDIKPSNIIFVDGVPKLADIGLVADVAAAQSYVGTEGYIPPEGPGDPQADIYSLGKVIYEISTGKDRCEFPRLPLELTESPEQGRFRELNEFVLQACAPNPSLRYRSAADMLADLALLENGESIRRLHILEQRFRRMRKLVPIAAVVLGLAGLVWFHANREKQFRMESRQRAVGSHLSSGATALRQGDLLGSFSLYVQAMELDMGPHELTHRLRLGTILHQAPKLEQLWSHEGSVEDVRFDARGQKICVTQSNQTVQVWSAQTGTAVLSGFGSNATLSAAAFSPDGKWIATARREIEVYDASSGRKEFALPRLGQTSDVTFSPDGNLLLVAYEDGVACLFDVRTRQQMPGVMEHAAPVHHARFSRDGKRIVTCSRDGTAQVWTLEGEKSGPALEHSSWVLDASFSPDGERVITSNFDRKARVFDSVTGIRLLPAMSHPDAIGSAEYSPDGQLILTAGWDSTVRLWDAHTGEPLPINPILRHKTSVRVAHFSPDGRRILAGCRDGTVWLWDLAATALDRVQLADRKLYPPVEMTTTIGPSTASAIADADRGSSEALTATRLLTPAEVRGVLSDPSIPTNTEIIIPRASPLPVKGRVSPDKRHLLVYAARSFQVFTETGQPVRPVTTGNRTALKSEFTPRGDKFALVHRDSVSAYDTHTAQLLYKRLGQDGEPKSIAFNPDGTKMIVCCTTEELEPASAQVWDFNSGTRSGPRLFHQDGVIYGCFSPDGRSVATGGEDFAVLLWDVKTGRRLTPPMMHSHQVNYLHFSADGRWLATSCRDGTAAIWETATGRPITPAFWHHKPVRAVKFVDSEHLATSEKEGHDWLWSLAVDRHSISELGLLADLLGGRDSSRWHWEDTTSDSKQRLFRAWEKLRRTNSTDFEATPAEVRAWHQQQLARCEETEHWSGAVLHCDRLLALQPDNEDYRASRDRAWREMQKAESGE